MSENKFEQNMNVLIVIIDLKRQPQMCHARHICTKIKSELCDDNQNCLISDQNLLIPEMAENVPSSIICFLKRKKTVLLQTL